MVTLSLRTSSDMWNFLYEKFWCCYTHLCFLLRGRPIGNTWLAEIQIWFELTHIHTMWVSQLLCMFVCECMCVGGYWIAVSTWNPRCCSIHKVRIVHRITSWLFDQAFFLLVPWDECIRFGVSRMIVTEKMRGIILYLILHQHHQPVR